MSTTQTIVELIENMRLTGSDSQTCEVKEAGVDLPKSLKESISAFANAHGGWIILGLSEKAGFHPVKNFDPSIIFSKMLGIGDEFTPIMRMEIHKVPFEGQTLIAAYIPETPLEEKPCYITANGYYQGSFIRTGDGDRRLTPYEIDRLREGRKQPQYDLEIVPNATLEDLDKTLLARILHRTRELFPRNFANRTDHEILSALGVIRPDEGVWRPTLGGLMAAGIWPQKFFPRLHVIFTRYPGTQKANGGAVRYVRSKELVGPIPDMLLETVELVLNTMETVAIIEGSLRKELPDYPRVAVREAIANALQHRDYSLGSRGAVVQVNMFDDRLEIYNPGGLYGPATIESLLSGEGISSQRNQFLSRLLTYTPHLDGFVVESKGTGIPVIEAELQKAEMPKVEIRDTLISFTLIIRKRQPKTVVEKEPVQKPLLASKRLSAPEMMELILTTLERLGPLSAKELSEHLGRSAATTKNYLKDLINDGKVIQTEPSRSPKQRYRLTDRP